MAAAIDGGPPIAVAVRRRRGRGHLRRLSPPRRPGERAARRCGADRRRRLRRPRADPPGPGPCGRSARRSTTWPPSSTPPRTLDGGSSPTSPTSCERRSRSCRREVEAQLDGIHPRDDVHLSLLRDQTRTLDRLVEDLRTLALGDAGRLTLHRETVSVASGSSTMRSPRSPPRAARRERDAGGARRWRRARCRSGAPHSGHDQPAHQRRAPHASPAGP